MKKKILAISGSTRKQSSNDKILQFIASNYHEQLALEIWEGIDQLPHFNSDLDQEPLPLAVQQLRNKIVEADGLLFCTPEYVFSLPGSFKNMLDWQVSTVLLTGKPVAFIVAAASGEKAFESLELILNTLEARLDAGSKLLIKAPKRIFGKDGAIGDAVSRTAIDGLVTSLLTTIRNTQTNAATQS